MFARCLLWDLVGIERLIEHYGWIWIGRGLSGHHGVRLSFIKFLFSVLEIQYVHG